VGNKMSRAWVLTGLSNLVQKVTKLSSGQTGRYENHVVDQCELLNELQLPQSEVPLKTIFLVIEVMRWLHYTGA
jgi:hypothetical protein